MRLSVAQAMLVGAQLAGLIALVAVDRSGAKKRHSSGEYFISPPRNWRKTFEPRVRLAHPRKDSCRPARG